MKQNTPEWHAARLGLVTASRVGSLLTATGQIAANKTSRALIDQLACERATGFSEDGISSFDMEHGKEMEPIARDYYSRNYAPVTECGFVRAGNIGASPDGFVNDDGIIEIKTRKSKYQFETILSGEVPSEYLPQIQMQLMVTMRDWCDFVSFCDGMPLFVKRVFPDVVMQETILKACKLAEEQILIAVEKYNIASANLVKTERIETANDDIV